MAQDIVIGGRLHSAATGNTVSGANEILDDAKGKKQNVINQEVDNEIGSDSAAGTIKGRIKNLETAVGSGGSVDERIAETKAEIIGDAAADYNTLGKVEDKIQETKSEILGDAASDYNTLGKVEDKIQAETSRAEAAEGALDNAKANKATTLEGYGITDAYTKSETYNKTEVNGLVETPHQNYVTVLTYAALIAIDPGSTDTIYRVSNYDGSVPQVDVTKYSEYAWDGTQYVFLCVKSQIDEVFDISVYNNNATYADLEAALGTDGANVPQTLRRGGMSVKYVQTSDNNYVQFRCKTQSFSANPEDWYFEGDDTLVENPEYLRAITDGAGHLLGWIRKEDGGIDWAVGVPKPVKDYVAAEIAKILNGSASTNIDGINKIIAFLNDFSTSDTLAELLATKVDKVEGKSLIDAEYANGVHYIENPEFAEVKVDNENRILEAIMKDGTKLLYAGVKVIGTAEYDGATIKTVKNPEFSGVWLDGEDKILFGVEQDGNFLFGCGVPQQVKDYIEQKIEELSLDEYESIVDFIGDYLNNTTLEELLSKKVDGEYVENPEFIEAKVDAEDKVLEGIQTDGTKVIGGDIKVLGNMEVHEVSYRVIENPEYLAAWIDAEDKIIFGFKTDGKTYIGNADFLDDIENIKAFLANFNDKNIDWEALTSIIATENPEFIDVELDADNKILGGRKTDGTKFENNNVELNRNATVGGSLKVNGVIIKNTEDPENRSEITLDSEEKIISYRKDDGTLVENVGVETPNITAENISAKEVNIEGGEAILEKATLNSLELTEEGMTEFQQALKDAGFQSGGAGDWSDYISNDGDNPLYIPEPRIAMINISGVENMPTAKGTNAEAYFEMYDTQGNYFKKKCILDAQGASSMQFVKKNFAVDLFDEDWNDDAFAVKIGNWVSQDSYHFKAFYTDFFKGVSIISYKIADAVSKTRGLYADRPWKTALLADYHNGSDSFDSPQKNDITLQLNNEARCMPDAFPCAVYLNGAFYGIFAWCLKKHRKNYHQEKDIETNVHLDGVISASTLFGANGVSASIGWDPTGDNGFEVRNPKDSYLVTTEGTQYNADAGIVQELAGVAVYGDTIPTYNSETVYAKGNIVTLNSRVYLSRKDNNTGNNPSSASYGNKPKDVFKKATEYWIEITFTNNTKNVILKFSTYLSNIQAAATTEAKKALIESYFDVDNLIDYIIVNCAVYDEDSFTKNWQWITYDGNKWFACEYDKDCSFGGHWTGMFTSPVKENGGWVVHEGSDMSQINTPLKYIINFYKQELKDRWNELVSKSVLSVDFFMSVVVDWVNRIGTDYFAREYAKWPESPCNRNNGVNTHWKLISVYTGSSQGSGNYDDTITYYVGDTCTIKYGTRYYFEFECVEECTGVYPVVQVSNDSPTYLGYRDSIWRLLNYITENLSNQNVFFNTLV